MSLRGESLFDHNARYTVYLTGFYGIAIGELPTDPKNTICDVKGITVGHDTIHEGEVHTGITALFPH